MSPRLSNWGITGSPQNNDARKTKTTSSSSPVTTGAIINYADLESLNMPVAGCINEPGESTRQIVKQECCDDYYLMVCCNGVVKVGWLYLGEHCRAHPQNSSKMNWKRPSQDPDDLRQLAAI